MSSESFSSYKTSGSISDTRMKPVALGSYCCQAFLKALICTLKTSKPSSSFELVKPFKITAMKRFKNTMLTIN